MFMSFEVVAIIRTNLLICLSEVRGKVRTNGGVRPSRSEPKIRTMRVALDEVRPPFGHLIKHRPKFPRRARHIIANSISTACSAMETIDVLSDNEETQLSTKWDPDKWISCGKIYYDVPPFVDTARRTMLEIPASFAQKLPSKSMSISQLLRCDLPPRSDGAENMDIDSDLFTPTEPMHDIEDVLPFLALPTRTMLNLMVSMFGQAWFDGQKSIRTWLNPEIAFPFWVLTYWGEMLDVCESKDAWLRAESWMNRAGKTADEKTMNLTVRGLWNVLRWHGHLQGFGNIQVVGLAALFSPKYLGSEIAKDRLAACRDQLTQPSGGNSRSLGLT
ncbi:hypothetical protein FB451DRAFT_1184404 [Mycena latifolia]|nr:hypothetical protein FB451DRAFT_1184404 [Mycena latifolia]